MGEMIGGRSFGVGYGKMFWGLKGGERRNGKK